MKELKLIEFNPKRKGGINVLGIPVIRGKHVPITERSTEVRNTIQRREEELDLALKHIEYVFDRVAIANRIQAEKDREEIKDSGLKADWVMRERNIKLKKRLKELMEKTGGDRQKAELLLLKEENGISPELLEMPVPPTLLKESLGGRGGGKETEKPGSYRKSLPPFLEKRDQRRK